MDLIKFPKQFMTITELCNLGLSRTDLKAYTSIEGFPCMPSKNGGKLFIDTNAFPKWLGEYHKKRKTGRR